jgi:metallo-beta-lactamase family protein
MSSPSIRFLGAAQEVTGSMHLLETPAGNILIDCGLYQGRRAEARARNAELPEEARSAAAVILTHAHIDHSGSLPTLCKRGFAGSIWSTPATRDLAALMLRDSARIQEADAAYLNRRFGQEPDWTPITPLYGEEDAISAVSRFVGVPYGTRFSPLPGVEATFIDAGHILGSAQIVLDIENPRRRLVFSGDLGRKKLPILRAPTTPPNADYLVMESTYGDRLHGSIGQIQDALEHVVRSAVARKGKIIVPAFAVGRTQELIFALNQLYRQGRIPEIPVFVDSPLAIHVTEVFKLHPECFDADVRAFVEREGDPFTFHSLFYVETAEDSMRLNDLKEPAIIIAASGMCEAGRVLHHLRNTVEDERNTILVVGFMAQHTLGRRLTERRSRVRILGVERELHARVEVIEGFSAHADKNDLRAYAGECRPSRGLFLVHGEPDQQGPLSRELAQDGYHVTAPRRGTRIELE